uniref:secretin N-terminal domain-containing protein n=1 Tax=Desulfonatronospira sp. TaxID=1962951 RepID=UPI0025BD3F5B
RVTTAEKLQAQRQRALEERESLRALEPVLQEYFQINYAKASELKPRIEKFLSEEQGRLDYDNRTNMLIVRDTASQLDTIRELINNLDRPERQVLIEARVVYATETFRRELGINWGLEHAHTFDRVWESGVNMQTMNFPDRMGNLMAVTGILEGQDRVAGSLFVLDAELRLGEAQDKSKTISSPQIMTLNNQQAEIEQGTRIAREVPDERGTRTEYVDALLKLMVQPQITPDNNLILNLKVTDDSPGEGGNIDTKMAQTTLLVRDGETIVIGGIKKLDEEALQHRVPGISNVPVLGRLFRQDFQRERKDELLIFIRPKIQ